MMLSCKSTFLGAGNLQMTINKFWCEYLCIVSGPSFVYIVLISYKVEEYSLESWWDKKGTGLHTKTNCGIVLHETLTSLDRG